MSIRKHILIKDLEEYSGFVGTFESDKEDLISSNY